jgi:hypothetical protein
MLRTGWALASHWYFPAYVDDEDGTMFWSLVASLAVGDPRLSRDVVGLGERGI